MVKIMDFSSPVSRSKNDDIKFEAKSLEADSPTQKISEQADKYISGFRPSQKSEIFPA